MLYLYMVLYATDGPDSEHIYDEPSGTDTQHQERAIRLMENPAYTTVTDYYDI